MARTIRRWLQAALHALRRPASGRVRPVAPCDLSDHLSRDLGFRDGRGERYDGDAGR